MIQVTLNSGIVVTGKEVKADIDEKTKLESFVLEVNKPYTYKEGRTKPTTRAIIFDCTVREIKDMD